MQLHLLRLRKKVLVKVFRWGKDEAITLDRQFIAIKSYYSNAMPQQNLNSGNSALRIKSIHCFSGWQDSKLLNAAFSGRSISIVHLTLKMASPQVVKTSITKRIIFQSRSVSINTKLTRWSGDVIWRTGKKNFNAVSHKPRAALGVVSKLPAAFPSPKLNRSFLCLPHFLLLNEHSSRPDEL